MKRRAHGGTHIKKNKTERRLLARRRSRPDRKASIIIRNLDMEPQFVLTFYGEDADRLSHIPGGGDMVAEALAQRGIDPSSVFFTLWDIQR